MNRQTRPRAARFVRPMQAGVVGLALALVAACGSGGSSGADASKSSASSKSSDQNLSAMLPDALRQSGTLRVGTDPELRPAEFVDPTTRQVQGYDIDLMNALATKLGLKVQLVQSAYAGLIPGLLAGRSDILGGAVTDTAQREQQVDFVDYMLNYQILLAPAKNPHHISSDPLSTCGLKVGLEIGGVDAAYGPLLTNDCTKAGKPAPVITSYTGQSSKTLALQSGQVDATFYTPIAFPDLQKATNNAFVSFKVKGFPQQLLGIAVPKGATQLQQAVLAALKALQADGTYDKIYKKWNLTDLEFKKPGVNLTTTDPSVVD